MEVRGGAKEMPAWAGMRRAVRRVRKRERDLRTEERRRVRRR